MTRLKFFFAVLFLGIMALLPVSTLAIIEAPHNQAAIGSCGNCHGQHLADSPFWGGAPDYNTFCWVRCHSNPTDRVSKGPAARTHSSTTTNSSRATWGYQCTACHYVHSHQQNNWDSRNYNEDEIYLATGYLTGPPVFDSGAGTTTFGISAAPGKEISYKNSNWTPVKLKQKTELNRGALLIPNEFFSAYNYAIYDMAADGSTITLYGDLRSAGWVPLISWYPFRIIYGQYVKSNIDKHNTPVDGSDDPETKFYDRVGHHSFADDETGVGTDADPTPDGVCQVCHEDTRHWSTATPAGDKHFSAWVCTECHEHGNGFKPGWPEHDIIVERPGFCASCHSDTTFDLHAADDVTYANCNRCHQVNNNYEFTGSLPTVFLDKQLAPHSGKDKHLLSSTSRCDDCHHGQFDEHVVDTGHGKLHDNVILGYDSNNDGVGDQVLACDACHYPDVIQEHVTRREFTCSVCHDRSELGLAPVAAVSNAIAAGSGAAGTVIFCDDCHDDDHFLTNAGTSLVKEHHYTGFSAAGNCRKCHLVGPGASGPARAPCWICHGQGKPRDPQRAGVFKHDQGPAFNGETVDDFRACFSCHLDGGPGFVNGVTPAVPGLLHPMPDTGAVVFWPYGYYKDGSNNWVAPPVLIPSNSNPEIPANLESEPAIWQGWPGFGTIRLLAEELKGKGQKYRYPENEPPKAWVWETPEDTDGEDYWGLRNQTDADFQMRDYPTVEITYGGKTEYLPSYDGSGAGGIPAGSGSLTVTINDAAAVSAGVRWRVDGGDWQTSGATVAGLTARGRHQVEYKPLAGWDEPEPAEVTIADLQTTVVSGAAATYSQCPPNGQNVQLDVVRAGGGTSFDWSRPEQVEIFPVTGWRPGTAYFCEVWQNSGAGMVAATGFTAGVSADGNSCLLTKDGATPAGSYDLVLNASGSSCFRNNDALQLTVNVTADGSPSPLGQAGGMIAEPEIDSLALGETREGDFIHLAANTYVHAARDGILHTFTIDSQGNISPVIDTADLWGNNQNGTIARLARVSDNLVAVAYHGSNGTDMSSYLLTVRIESDGTITGIRDTYNFHSGYWSLAPVIFPHAEADLFIVSFRADDILGGASQYRAIMTVHIDPNGQITEIDRETSYANYSDSSEILHLAGDYYAFMNGSNLKTLAIDREGFVTSPLVDEYQFDSSNGYGEMISLGNGIYALSYSTGANSPGYLKTLEIADNGMITKRAINTFMFEPCSTGHYGGTFITRIAENVVGVYYYEYTGCSGTGTGVVLKTIGIDDAGRMQAPVVIDTMKIGGYNCKHPRLIPIGDDIFAMSLTETDPSRTFFGVKTYRISTDNDEDGISFDSDNCPEAANASQDDADADGVGDGCERCPGFDDAQDADGDTIPDACDLCPGSDDRIDSDSDGVADGCDPCPGDPADDSGDSDGICIGGGFNSPKAGDNDNCPLTANADQADSDCDGAGDACSVPVYFTPAAKGLSPATAGSLVISFGDAMQGEDGYRIEGKLGSCADNTYSHGPVTTVYRYDRFDSGIDPLGWVQGAVVQSGSTATPPAAFTDASGTAEVVWEDGKVRLHNLVNDMSNPGGFNYSYISPLKAADLVGDKDFDVQVDYELPNGAFLGDQYHADLRLVFYFPQTDGKGNEFYVERRAGDYVGTMVVNGVLEYDNIPTTDMHGTMRLVRRNRELSAYVLDHGEWVLLKTHSQPQTADLVPTWVGVVQYAQRNESGGAELTAVVDNFRFNTVGSVPIALADLPMDEAAWQGYNSEVRDATPNSNHATAHNGADTVDDAERGRVGSFDGIDDYIELPGTGDMENVTDRSFTFAAWIRPDSVPPGNDTENWTNVRYTVIGRPGWHSTLHYDVSKTLRMEVVNDAGGFFVAGSPQYDPNEWHHVAGVVDDGAKQVRMYVDGILTGTQDYTGSLRDYGTSPYYIGAANPPASMYTWHFSGLIDDARVFDRALSAAEVTALHLNRIEFIAKGLAENTPYCTRVYPFKSNDCANWPNHAAEADATTLTSAEAAATTAGKAAAVSLRGANSLYVSMPYLNDNNGNNTYTVEYKLSSAGTWTTHVADVAHVASPYATTISGLTLFEKYDVRVTYGDDDGVNGTGQQVIVGVPIEPGPSCLSILNNGGAVGDGVYWLDPDRNGPIAPFQAYCDMTTDGGGWTLAMKLDGGQSTFQYSANYWTTSNTLNAGSPGFDTTQAKLESFNAVAFSQVRLGMRNLADANDDIDWITVNQRADSLVSLFNSGWIPTYVGRDNWLALLEGISTQPNCNKEGFNAEQSYSKMRVGIAMNQEADCNTCDRILGFGNQPSGHPWGSWAVVGGGYPGTNTQAYGWILVR